MKKQQQSDGRAGRLPVGDLSTFTGNPRRGQVDVIADSLSRNGQYRPIVVNEGTKTGRPNEVLAGNHTLQAARKLGWDAIDVWIVDVDDAQARRIVAADNRTADLGEYDNADLLALLEGLDGDLEGTGYDEDFLAELEDAARPPDSADALDPPAEDNYNRQFAVTVICRDEDHQRQVYEALEAEGLECRVVSV